MCHKVGVSGLRSPIVHYLSPEGIVIQLLLLLVHYLNKICSCLLLDLNCSIGVYSETKILLPSSYFDAQALPLAD